MADVPGYPAGDDTATEPSGGSPTGTPRWVKWLAIIGIVVVLLVVIFDAHRPQPWSPRLARP